MRLNIAALALCLCLACPALAAGPAQEKSVAEVPTVAEVQEYLRLFGYRQMLETGAERQLAAIIEEVRQSRQPVSPGALELIQEELRSELGAASENAVNEMVAVLQRHLSRQDVVYLLEVGRDPRMQRVVKLQPAIASDMEAIGERLAETVTTKAAPKIAERLKALETARPQ